jgi:choline dehydrogenase-like flavoprotein
LEDETLGMHYREAERDLSVSPLPDAAPPASQRLQLGAEALGWRAIEALRCFKYQPDGSAQKQAMSETMLPRACAAGARVRCESRVSAILRQNGSWLVRTRSAGGNAELRSQAVFVCGGAVQTPFLLRRSGLSARAGRMLHLHPTCKIAALFDDEVNAPGSGVGVHQVKHFSPRFTLGCSISSRPHLHLALQHLHGGDALVERHWRRMAIYYVMVSDGAGSVDAVPGMDAPLVRYAAGEEGARNLREGALQLCRLLFAAGARALYPSIMPGLVVRSVREAQSWAAAFQPASAGIMTIHLMGSCPMGEETSRCVTDSYGAVRGQQGLYVNDASLLCTALGVNPQGTVMAVARRNVAAFLAGA